MQKKETSEAGVFKIEVKSPSSELEWDKILSDFEACCKKIFQNKNIAIISFSPKKSLFHKRKSICFKLQGIEKIYLGNEEYYVNYLGEYDSNYTVISEIINNQEFHLGLLAFVSYKNRSHSFIKKQIEIFQSLVRNNYKYKIPFESDFVFLSNDANCLNWYH